MFQLPGSRWHLLDPVSAACRPDAPLSEVVTGNTSSMVPKPTVLPFANRFACHRHPSHPFPISWLFPALSDSPW